MEAIEVNVGNAGTGAAVQELPAQRGEVSAPPMPMSAGAGGILGERWPTLAGAMACYERNVAEDFCKLAYGRVFGGLIRMDDRTALANEAEARGIRSFDAQLLIACAIRQWVLDNGMVKASRAAPALRSPSGGRWRRFSVVLAAAVGLDALLIWCWLG